MPAKYGNEMVQKGLVSHYFEVSALTSEGIETMFRTAAQSIFDKMTVNKNFEEADVNYDISISQQLSRGICRAS